MQVIFSRLHFSLTAQCHHIWKANKSTFLILATDFLVPHLPPRSATAKAPHRLLTNHHPGPASLTQPFLISWVVAPHVGHQPNHHPVLASWRRYRAITLPLPATPPILQHPRPSSFMDDTYIKNSPSHPRLSPSPVAIPNPNPNPVAASFIIPVGSSLASSRSTHLSSWLNPSTSGVRERERINICQIEQFNTVLESYIF